MLAMGGNAALRKEVAGDNARKYATGAKVYNGTSNSPHSGGGLDKTGYATRDRVAAATKAMLAKRNTRESWQ